MADNDQGQEKTEQATQKKLDKAKEDGQVPRSKELTTTFILLASAFGFLWFGGFLAKKIISVFQYSFEFPRGVIFDTSMMVHYLGQAFAAALIGVLPFFGVLLLAALIGPVALGGWLFSTKSLMPKFSRMNPLEGIKRMFSFKSLVELVKAMAKIILIFSVVTLVFTVLKSELAALAFEDLLSATGHAVEILVWVTIVLSTVTILIAVIDVPFQIFDHTEKLKMTLQDVKDEMKDTDGRPEVKGRIRQLQQEMANKRMMSDVPEADVVITNPTHFAIAVKYKPDSMNTPIVVAKGVDAVALKIREVAGANHVEIIESPRLARAIYYTTKIDQEIPAGLYIAVAKILAYVFQLQNFRRGRGDRPTYPRSVVVPKDMIYDE
ncbi:MAG: flagellar biosynthetic protein FlhB [Pseudohongiellaceae bacterium]|jgi:flagellar biosynthetic protein FlhB